MRINLRCDITISRLAIVNTDFSFHGAAESNSDTFSRNKSVRRFFLYRAESEPRCPIRPNILRLKKGVHHVPSVATQKEITCHKPVLHNNATSR